MEQETDSRRRQIYSLTPAGRMALRAWLKEAVGEPFQVRNVAELKLFCGELADEEDLRVLAEEHVTLHRERLAEFQRTSDRFAADADRAGRMVPLAMGVRLEEAALEFWEEQLG
ncbi:hypothetical protein [Yimella lutea]|uniref:hypothetical protein n=1 Tax=Yimella lutea TaxID=587872 RepID=UPI001B87F482|nr:hypothetical protein [Yimella lutea]